MKRVGGERGRRGLTNACFILTLTRRFADRFGRSSSARYARRFAHHYARRRSLGVDLRGSIVVVDEAHNIPEALRQVANSRVSKENLERLSKTFKIYFTKYSERLSGKNLEVRSSEESQRRAVNTILAFVLRLCS